MTRVLWKELFETSVDGISLTTTDGTICDPSKRSEPAREQRRRTERFEGTLHLRQGDGKPLPATVSIAVGQDGETEDSVVVTFQETAAGGGRTRQTSQYGEEYFRILVENALDMIVVAEADGTLRYANPAAERILGRNPEELVGTKSYDYVHPEDFQKAAKCYAEAVNKPGETALMQVIRCRHADGTWRYLEGFAQNLLDDPNVRGMLFTARDVTESKRLEDELLKRNQILEDLVTQRTAQPEAVLPYLESKERMLRESEARLEDLVRRLSDVLCRALDGAPLEDQSLGPQLPRDLGDEAERGGEPPQSAGKKRLPKPQAEPLTPREAEVLELLAQGQTNREIARSLVVSVGTAKLHVHRVISKLGVCDRTQAALLAISLGLLQNM